MVQTSAQMPADGVKIQIVPAQSAVPTKARREPPFEPPVVLARDNELPARSGPLPRARFNDEEPDLGRKSSRPSGSDPSGEIDAAAEPQWQQVADAPRWTWLELRAAAPRTDPPQAVIDRGRRVTVKTWSVPYLIGGRKGVIEGTVEFVPLAELRRQAGGGASGGGSRTALYAGIAVAGLALSGWFLRTRLR